MKQTIDDLNQPVFWQHAWEKARKSSKTEKRKIRDNKEVMEFWNRFAPKYEKRHSPGNVDHRVQGVLDMFLQQQILNGETAVLDIGCGPGTHALPLAEICKSVTALDGAGEMCLELEKKVKEKNIGNIKVLHRMWEDVDIKKENMLKKFDLVLASMTTAVCDYETLDKMNQASRNNCCLIFWAQNSSNQARKELWKILFQEEDPGYGAASVIYPFNLLFSLGYYPEMRYIDSEWTYKEPVDEAIESLCRSFWLFTEITPYIKETITSYVQEKAENNIFSQKTKARLGVVTWSVNAG